MTTSKTNTDQTNQINTVNTDQVFTIIYFPDDNLYQEFKHKLKKIIDRHDLVQNKKDEILACTDVIEIYTVCGYDISNIQYLKNGIAGIVRILENIEKNEAIKIIMFEKRISLPCPSLPCLSLPCLMMYKGNENLFYKEFLQYCIGIGCTVSKVAVNDNGIFEEIYKKRKQTDEQIFKFRNAENTKDEMKKIFLDKISELNKKTKLTDLFTEQWIKLIDVYGILNWI